MTLENWAEIGKLIKLTPSRDNVLAIFGVVERNFRDASLNGLSSDQKYILSYQAALEVAIALLHCHGYKPIKAGHHYITWQCLKEMLPQEHRPVIALFQDAAKKRSKLSYDIAGLASQKEADEMYKEAKYFVNFVKEQISVKFNINI